MFGYYLVVVAFGTVRAILGESSLWWDVGVVLILATFLILLRSRIAAILLLIYSILNFTLYFLGLFGVIEPFKVNVFMAALFVYAGARSVQATFLLRGAFAETKEEVPEGELLRRQAPLGAISLISAAMTIVPWIILWTWDDPEVAQSDEWTLTGVILFASSFGLWVLNGVAAAIGLAGMIALRKKALSIWGMVTNGLCFVGYVVLLVAYVMKQAGDA